MNGDKAFAISRSVRLSGFAITIAASIVCLTLACGRSASTVDEGRALYAANGCASCHGSAGRGDGPVAKTLTPPPRDFHDLAAFKNGTDVSSIAETIATGLATDGGRMPQFNHLTRDEQASLALYVIALRADARDRKEHP